MYKIINKGGRSEFFKPNKSQMTLLDDLWYMNVIDKARQLGMSTFIALFGLDYCLFNDNVSFGVIDQKLPEAKKKLQKIRYAYENIPEEIKSILPTIVTDNKEEIVFSNGSSVTVGTSHRGGTLNILWISEYGPIGKKFPERAEEIRTGALNTVATGQIVFIESTSSGKGGHFYDICMNAHKNTEELTKMDFKLFFFPWFDDPGYSLEIPEGVKFSSESVEYFKSLEDIGIKLTDDQKYWYVKKKSSQGESMKQEYPSTLEESFEATDKDKHYGKQILKAYKENRVCEFPIEQGVPIDCWWDLGRSDLTSIGFVQQIGKEPRAVDYFEDNGEHISYFAEQLKKKGYLYGTMYLPHDASFKLLGQKKTIVEQLTDLGFRCRVVPRIQSKELGYNEVRLFLDKMWFRKSTCTQWLDHLSNYRKKWNESLGLYLGEVHDEHSHCADMTMGLAMTLIKEYVEDQPSILDDLFQEDNTGGNPFCNF